MLSSITIPPCLVGCTFEGLRIEFGTAVEQLATTYERTDRWLFEPYREPLKCQADAQALLEELGDEASNPAEPIKVNSVHRPILLRILEEQQQSYVERLDDMTDKEQRAATELIQEIHAFIVTLKAIKPQAMRDQ